MKAETDKDLAFRLQQGDVGAFNKLFLKYSSAVYANALKITRDVEISQDIVQEVFIALWEKRNTIDPLQEVEGWLFVVSYNKAIDKLKRKLKDAIEQKKLQTVFEVYTDTSLNLRDVQLNTLENAMTQLSPQKRKVFELCKLKGLTYEKAATELHISKHTVKEYLSEAIIIIKKYVKQHPDHYYLLAAIISLRYYFGGS